MRPSPSDYTILSGTSVGGTADRRVGHGVGRKDEAIGDDPRVFIRTLSALGFRGGPGCEMSRDPSETGSGTAAAGWRYVGAESVAGRPAHHLTCAGEDLWIDDRDAADPARPGSSRLTTRATRSQAPIPTKEVTEIEFGEQPAALFASHRQRASLP